VNTLRDALEAMLNGDAAAVYEFLRRQPTEALQPTAEACGLLARVLHNLQLRDPEAFLRAKYPDPLPAIDAALFRRALTAAFEHDQSAARDVLAPLALPELIAVSALCERLRLACRLRVKPGLGGIAP
jgi:hypothetical protein